MAPCVLAADDERVDIDLRTAGEKASRTSRSARVGVRSQFRRRDEAEILDRADFVLVDHLALPVLGHMDEASQVADIGLGIGMDKHQVGRFDRQRADVDRRSKNPSDLLGVVGLQSTRSLAQNLERQLLIDRQAGRAAAVENVGASLDDAIADHFADQADALTALLFHLGRNVVFVQVDNHVTDLVQAAVLRQANLDIIRHERIGGWCGAFRERMQGRIDNRAVFGVVVGRQRTIRAIATHRNGLAVVLRQ